MADEQKPAAEGSQVAAPVATPAAPLTAEKVAADLQKQNPGLDYQTLFKAVTDLVKAGVDGVREEIKPLQEEVAVYRTASKLGLNPQEHGDQIAAVAEVQKQFQGIGQEEALAIARVRKPDLFKTAGVRMQSVPVSGGASPNRQPPLKDFNQQIADAKTPEERAHFSMLEFQRRIVGARQSIPAR